MLSRIFRARRRRRIEAWSHDDLEQLVAGYVLLNLEPHEQKAVEQHLLSCDGCAREVTELSVVVHALALLCVNREPPTRLKERIMAAIRAERAGPSARTVAIVDYDDVASSEGRCGSKPTTNFSE